MIRTIRLQGFGEETLAENIRIFFFSVFACLAIFALSFHLFGIPLLSSFLVLFLGSLGFSYENLNWETLKNSNHFFEPLAIVVFLLIITAPFYPIKSAENSSIGNYPFYFLVLAGTVQMNRFFRGKKFSKYTIWNFIMEFAIIKLAIDKILEI